MRKILFIFLSISSMNVWASTYYVDPSGLDSNNGLSSTSAWKSLSKVNSVSFVPGDFILFKKGEVFRGQLKPISSGSSALPITYSAYGDGNPPIIINSKNLVPAGTAWTPSSNGEFYLDIGSTSEFPPELGVLRGQPTGVDSYKRVILGFNAGSLATDTYVVVSSGDNRRIYYKPPNGHVPSEYDWEFAKYGDGTILFNSNISNIVVDGIVFLNSAFNGTNYGLANFLGKNCTVINCTLQFGYYFNAMFLGSSCQYNILKNCKIMDSKGSGIHLLNNNSYNTVNGCEITRCSLNPTPIESCGVDRGPICSLPSSYNTIIYNYLHDNGCDDTTRYYAEIHCDGGVGWDMSWNTIINSPFKAMACTITDGTVAAHHNHFDYNLIWNWDRYNHGYDKNIAIMIFTTGKSNSNTAGFDTANNNTIVSDKSNEVIGISIANYSNGGYGKNMQAVNNIIYSNNANSQGIRLRQSLSYYPGLDVDFNDIYSCIAYTITDVAITQADMENKGCSFNDFYSDPQFVSSNNFYLKSSSPCVNSGGNTNRTEDIEHNPIIGIVDRGAYEYQSYPPPGNTLTAMFSVSTTSGLSPLTVSFTDTSIGNPTSWFWDFGDGSTGNTQNPVHTYNDAGTYTAKLTVSNTGNSDYTSKTITVTTASLVANFSASPASGRAPLTVSFTDTSSGNPTSWSWNFGDGGTSNFQNPTHSFSTVGTFTVTLTVTNSAGFDSFSKQIKVTGKQ